MSDLSDIPSFVQKIAKEGFLGTVLLSAYFYIENDSVRNLIAASLVVHAMLLAIQVRQTQYGKQALRDFLLSGKAKSRIQLFSQWFSEVLTGLYHIRKRFLISFPSPLRAIVIGSLIFVVVCVLFSSVSSEFFTIVATTASVQGRVDVLSLIALLVSLIIFNALFDGVSVAETHYMIDRIKDGSLRASHVLIIDLLFSFTVSFAFFVCYVFVTQYLPGSVPLFFIDAETLNRLYTSTFLESLLVSIDKAKSIFFGIFLKPRIDWALVDQLRFLFFITTLSTSIWLWVYASSLMIGEWLLKFSHVASIMRRYFDFDDEPLRYVSYLTACMILGIGISVSFAFSITSKLQEIVLSLSNIDVVSDRSTEAQIELPLRQDFTIFFDFDTTRINPEAGSTLLDVQTFFESVMAVPSGIQPNCRVLISGHTDAPGTREYNLALGERMANAAKDYLVSRGVPTDVIETVSYGEERPRFTPGADGRNVQNNRAEIAVSCEP